MKYITFFVMLVISIHVYAQEDFSFNFNSGHLGFGGNFPLNDVYNSEINLTVLNIGIEHKATRLGLEFSPYKHFSWRNPDEYGSDDTLNHSFINLNLYWNVLTLLDDFVYLGPFTSVNYLFVGEYADWNSYMLTAGGRLGFRMRVGRLNYSILSTEMGYRNINGRSKYFIGAKIDLASFIVLAFMAVLSMGASEEKSSN